MGLGFIHARQQRNGFDALVDRLEGGSLIPSYDGIWLVMCQTPAFAGVSDS